MWWLHINVFVWVGVLRSWNSTRLQAKRTTRECWCSFVRCSAMPMGRQTLITAECRCYSKWDILELILQELQDVRDEGELHTSSQLLGTPTNIVRHFLQGGQNNLKHKLFLCGSWWHTLWCNHFSITSDLLDWEYWEDKTRRPVQQCDSLMSF